MTNVINIFHELLQLEHLHSNNETSDQYLYKIKKELKLIFVDRPINDYYVPINSCTIQNNTNGDIASLISCPHDGGTFNFIITNVETNDARMLMGCNICLN
jgi:hypothetical protein